MSSLSKNNLPSGQSPVKRGLSAYGGTMQNLQWSLNNLQPVDLDARQVFSGRPSGTRVKGYASPSAYTPAIDPNYVFHEASRDVPAWFVDPQEPLYVFGPTGCGKTSCIKGAGSTPSLQRCGGPCRQCFPSGKAAKSS